MRKHSLTSLGLGYYILLVAFLYLPIFLLIIFSFNDSAILSFPLKGFTLDWYRQLLDAHELLGAVWNSIIVGVVSSIVATVIGAAAAVAVLRYTFPGKSLLLALAAMPLVMPSIVIGVSLLILFRQTFGIELTLWGVTASHVLISIPTTMLIVMARLAGFPQNLEDAAMDLGANYWVTLWRVTLPLSLPALLAAFLTAFTTSFDEYAMTVFIVGTKPTLPVYLYSQLRFPRRLPMVIALGSIIMVVSISMIVLAEWLRRLNGPRAKPIEGENTTC